MADNKDHVNVITVEAYRCGAVGEIESVLKLIRKNRDELILEALERVLEERLKQLR